MIFTRLRYIPIKLLPLLLWAGGLAACSDSGLTESAPTPASPGSDDPTITVVVRVPSAGPVSASRANPESGDNGNGREEGILNENSVHDVNLFFYVADGLNPPYADVTVAGVYVNDMTGSNITTEELPLERRITIKISPSDGELATGGILEASSAVSFITVLNAGEDLSSRVSTLADLREYSGFTSSWSVSTPSSLNAEDCDHFLMTTAYDTNAAGYVSLSGTPTNLGSNRLVKTVDPDTGMDKWNGETTVQRLAARIDLMYASDNLVCDEDNNLTYLSYTVISTAGKPHNVKVMNARTVNVMQHPSYLLSHLTSGIPTEWTAATLGSITYGGIQTVTGAKSVPSNYVIEPHTLLKSDDSSPSLLEQWYGSSATDNVKSTITDPSKGALSEYFTGLLPQQDLTYTPCDGMMILGYANENTQSPDQFNSKYLTGIVLRALYRPGRLYRKIDGNLVYTDYDTDPQAWEALDDKSFTRYYPTATGDNSADKALYFASYAEAMEYASSHPEDHALLTRYADGVCYYNLWLRHYNDESADPYLQYPMEYAIVRNNIYRVVLSFSGPGDPEPTMREPDTMQARIFVRKWNLRTEKEPLQF